MAGIDERHTPGRPRRSGRHPGAYESPGGCRGTTLISAHGRHRYEHRDSALKERTSSRSGRPERCGFRGRSRDRLMAAFQRWDDHERRRLVRVLDALDDLFDGKISVWQVPEANKSAATALDASEGSWVRMLRDAAAGLEEVRLTRVASVQRSDALDMLQPLRERLAELDQD